MQYPIYRDPPSSSSLSQGDILDPEPLRANLRGHQEYFIGKPHFYRYMVLTQTCDLDNSRETADYIFLAVVRRLSEVLGIRHVETESARNKTFELLRDLYNHNYNKHGYFYLPADSSYRIDVESLADLRVMFSVHKEHYSDLLLARRASITDLYAAQLGNLAGHMFARIATPGWQELNPGVKLNKHIKQVSASIGAREKARLGELLRETGNVCSINHCTEKPITYRWLRVKDGNSQTIGLECALCAEHAKQRDRSELRQGELRSQTQLPRPDAEA